MRSGVLGYINFSLAIIFLGNLSGYGSVWSCVVASQPAAHERTADLQ